MCAGVICAAGVRPAVVICTAVICAAAMRCAVVVHGV